MTSLIAESIGFFVLGLITLMAIITVVSIVHEFLCAHSRRYDLYWYDDVTRANRKWKDKQ